MFALEPSKAPPSSIRHDVLDNPKTPAHSSLSRIAIYQAPLTAKTLRGACRREPKTGQVGRIRGRRGSLGAGLKSKVPPFFKASSALTGAGGAGGAGKIKFHNAPFSGTILHATDLPPLPPVISGAAHLCPEPAEMLIS